MTKSIRNFRLKFPFDFSHSNKWVDSLLFISLTQFLLWFWLKRNKTWRSTSKSILSSVKWKTVKFSHRKRLRSELPLPMKRMNVWHNCEAIDINGLLCLWMFVVTSTTSRNIAVAIHIQHGSKVALLRIKRTFLSHTYTTHKSFVCVHKFIVCVCVLFRFFSSTLLYREAKVCHLFNRLSMKVSGSNRNKKWVSVCAHSGVCSKTRFFVCYVHVLNFKSNTHLGPSDEYDFSFSVFSFVSLNTSNPQIHSKKRKE